MKIRLIASLVLFVAFQARADFSGRWVGEGKARDGASWASQCQLIEFDFRQSETSFELRSGHVRCGSLKVEWRPFAMAIIDGALWLAEKNIGSISETDFHAETAVSKLKVRQFFDMHLTPAGRLGYREEWQDIQSGAVMFLIEGELVKSDAPAPRPEGL